MEGNPAGHPFDNECCADMVEMKTWVTLHEKRHDTIDAVLDKLLNRLPLWATVIMSGLSATVGWLLASK